MHPSRLAGRQGESDADLLSLMHAVNFVHRSLNMWYMLPVPATGDSILKANLKKLLSQNNFFAWCFDTHLC